MSIYWVPVGLAATTALISAFFFSLYLGSQEPVPLERARAFYRWTVVIGLGTFDVWIFSRVISALIALWW